MSETQIWPLLFPLHVRLACFYSSGIPQHIKSKTEGRMWQIRSLTIVLKGLQATLVEDGAIC